LANPDHLAKLKEGVEAWNNWRRENPGLRPDLRRLDFAGELRGTKLWGGPWDAVERVDLGASPGWYKGEKREAIDFSNTDLGHSDLTGARLEKVDFRKARLWGTNLSETDLWGANIRKARLRSANISGARLSHVVYKRNELCDLCLGVRGAETTHGNAVLRRDILDQDVIDTLRWQWRKPRWNLKRALILWPWAFFDYGRGWGRVVAFAVTVIGLFGLGYRVSAGNHLDFLHEGRTVEGPFYPWFVASMGFATLGISDLVEPRDLIGQALMIGNVISGFITLGLLLSVLGNSFARRS